MKFSRSVLFVAYNRNHRGHIYFYIKPEQKDDKLKLKKKKRGCRGHLIILLS